MDYNFKGKKVKIVQKYYKFLDIIQKKPKNHDFYRGITFLKKTNGVSILDRNIFFDLNNLISTFDCFNFV